MYLDSTQALDYIQAAAKTTLDGSGQVSYEDIPINTSPGAPVAAPIPGTVPFTTNGVTAVPLLSAPAVGYVRKVISIQLNNTDTGTITPSFRITTTVAGTATTRPVFKGTRATLEQLNYTLSGGWQGYSVAMAKQ